MTDQEQQSVRRQYPLLRTMAGLVLVALGFSFLFERATGFHLHLFWLAIGGVFLVAWFAERKYGYLVPGSILTGLGLASVINSFLASLDPAIFLFGLAAGFFFISVLDKYRARSSWGLVVGTVLAAMAAAVLGVRFDLFLGREAAEVLLPVLLIGIGLLLLLRGTIPARTRRAVLIFLVLAATLIFTSSGAGLISSVVGFGRAEASKTLQMPDLAGRTLVVETSSGEVTLRTGPLGGRARITAAGATRRAANDRLSKTRIAVNESSSEVVISHDSGGGEFFRETSVDFDLEVPSGADVRVDSASGDVDSDLDEGGSLEIETGSGDIEIQGTYESVSVRTASGDVSGLVGEATGSDISVTVRTASGDVELDVSAEDPSLEIESSSGNVEVIGFRTVRSSERFVRAEGSRGSVSIATASGDVELRKVGAFED